jgi:hypothetical protein
MWCSMRVPRGDGAPETGWRRWTKAGVIWSSVAKRVEHGEAKLGRKMEPVEGGGPHGHFI